MRRVCVVDFCAPRSRGSGRARSGAGRLLASTPHGAALLVSTLLVSVLQVISVYFAARVAMGMGRDWRAGIFERVQSFSAQEMNHFGAASLITRNTNDVQQVQMFMVIALTVLASAPMMAVGGVIMSLYENAQLSLLLLVVIPAMAGVIGGLLYFAVPLFRSVQAKIDRINQVLREQITGVRVIRAFVRARYESDDDHGPARQRLRRAHPGGRRLPAHDPGAGAAAEPCAAHRAR